MLNVYTFCCCIREEEEEEEEEKRETERDGTLLHTDKYLSTNRPFYKSVPDDKQSSTECSKI